MTELANDRGSTELVSVSPPKRRRKSWVIMGSLIVVFAALAGAYMFAAVSKTVPVMVAGKDLIPGEPIGTADLRVVEMSVSPDAKVVTADNQAVLLGKVARHPIPAGSIVNEALVVDASGVVPAGSVVVGVTLSRGESPISSLRVGDSVDMVAVEPVEGRVDVATSRVLGPAQVWAVNGVAEGNDTVWVSLLVTRDLQGDVAAAASQHQLRLSLVGAG